MRCPECDRELSSLTVGGVTVDVCQAGCGGIWFDHGELQKFDEESESAGEALLDISPAPGVEVDLTKRFRCPKCPDGVLERHLFSVDRAVVVDECPTCGGYWLDPGELRQIRGEYPSEGARKQAAQEYFDELFGDRLTAQRAQDEAHLARAQHLAHIFRFICPSYYIPGKQGWGAF